MAPRRAGAGAGPGRTLRRSCSDPAPPRPRRRRPIARSSLRRQPSSGRHRRSRPPLPGTGPAALTPASPATPEPRLSRISRVSAWSSAMMGGEEEAEALLVHPLRQRGVARRPGRRLEALRPPARPGRRGCGAAPRSGRRGGRPPPLPPRSPARRPWSTVAARDPARDRRRGRGAARRGCPARPRRRPRTAPARPPPPPRDRGGIARLGPEAEQRPFGDLNPRIRRDTECVQPLWPNARSKPCRVSKNKKGSNRVVVPQSIRPRPSRRNGLLSPPRPGNARRPRPPFRRPAPAPARDRAGRGRAGRPGGRSRPIPTPSSTRRRKARRSSSPASASAAPCIGDIQPEVQFDRREIRALGAGSLTELLEAIAPADPERPRPRGRTPGHPPQRPPDLRLRARSATSRPRRSSGSTSCPRRSPSNMAIGPTRGW